MTARLPRGLQKASYTHASVDPHTERHQLTARRCWEIPFAEAFDAALIRSGLVLVPDPD